MSLKSFFTGGGPAYRLTGDAPSAAGQALVSTGDGTAIWGSVAGGGGAGDWTLSEPMIDAGGQSAGVCFVWTGVTGVLSDSGVSTGVYKRVQVMVNRTTSFRDTKGAVEFLITIPGITTVANGSDIYGTCEVALNGVEETLYTTQWYLPNNSNQLAIEVPSDDGGPGSHDDATPGLLVLVPRKQLAAGALAKLLPARYTVDLLAPWH